MRRTGLYALAVACAVAPSMVHAQAPKAATYITDEEVKKVNAQPGIDRTIRVVDIGNFGSPAHQHWCSTLRVLPYVVVYTPEGKMLAEHPGFRRGWVEKTIDEHARSAKGPRAAH